MSEFRIFCMSAFIGAGLFSAFMNHVVKAPPTGRESADAIAMLLIFGCLGVTLFGKRRSA